MKAMLLLCDSAQVADGKLFVLGGGWNIAGPEPASMGLAMLFEVPWDRANEQHQLKLEIVDADGNPVMLVQREDAEPEPLVIQAAFEVGRPVGIKRGSPLNVPLAINLPPIPLAPNQRYEWRMTVNDDTHEDWRVAFQTRQATA